MATTKKAAVAKETPAKTKAVAKKSVAKKEVEAVAKSVAKAVMPKWTNVAKRDREGLVWEELAPLQFFINQLGDDLNKGQLGGVEITLQKALVSVSIARQMRDIRRYHADEKGSEALLQRGREMLEGLNGPLMEMEITHHFIDHPVFDLRKRRKKNSV